jgi:hypothetical protein
MERNGNAIALFISIYGNAIFLFSSIYGKERNGTGVPFTRLQKMRKSISIRVRFSYPAIIKFQTGTVPNSSIIWTFLWPLCAFLCALCEIVFIALPYIKQRKSLSQVSHFFRSINSISEFALEFCTHQYYFYRAVYLSVSEAG